MFQLTSRVLQTLHRRRRDPNAAEKPAAGVLVHFLLVPHGDRDAIAARQEQIVVRVPLGVDGRLADVGGEDLAAVHCDLREGIGKSWEEKFEREN